MNPHPTPARRPAVTKVLGVAIALASTLASTLLVAPSASAAVIPVPVPEPYSHSLRVSTDAPADLDPLILPSSATSIRFVIADPTLTLSTVTYRAHGEDFESTGVAGWNPATRVVTVPLPPDFFVVAPGHNPVFGGFITGEDGQIIPDPTPYYGVDLSGVGSTSGPIPPDSAQVPHSPPGNSLQANILMKATGDTGETSPTLRLAWDPDEPWEPFAPKSSSHFERRWVPQVQTIGAGDTVTLVAGPGFFYRGLGAPYWATTRIAYSSQPSGFFTLELQNTVSPDGSTMTLTVPEELNDFERFPGEPRIEVILESGFEGQDYVDVFVPIAIEYRVAPPGRPSIVSASAGNSAVRVSWSAPATDGGAAITGYRVRAFSATGIPRTVTVGRSPEAAVVSGLTNGARYVFDVTAINPAGVGVPSARTGIVTPRVETVPPTVTARSPSPGATSVSRTANATARFSEPIARTSGTVARLTADGIAVRATLSYNARTLVATLDPTSPLAAGTTYLATVSGVVDAAGNLLAPVEWSFTTATAALP